MNLRLIIIVSLCTFSVFSAQADNEIEFTNNTPYPARLTVHLWGVWDLSRGDHGYVQAGTTTIIDPRGPSSKGAKVFDKVSASIATPTGTKEAHIDFKRGRVRGLKLES